MREYLLGEGLVINPDDFTRYNGMWANVRTRHLSADELQYLVWVHQNQVMGWWEPSERVRARGPVWTAIWRFAFRPISKSVSGACSRSTGGGGATRCTSSASRRSIVSRTWMTSEKRRRRP